MRQSFSCFVIGDGSLTLQCLNILLGEGHEVRGIITSNPEIKSWAKATGVPQIDYSTNLAAVIGQRPFDYLFSIVNMRLLPAEIVALPRRGAINFHDGPLPRYAGVHATSWALMNGERTHGVTWHLINDVVDGGPILKQELLEISKTETAYSLNVLCFEAGARTFPEVVRALANGNTAPRAQDLSQRSYYGMYQRPAAASVISWELPGRETVNFIRAFEFGSVANPLGRAKVWLKGELFLCAAASSDEASTDFQPGTILEIGESSLRVATARGSIILEELLTVDGKPASLTNVVKRHHLQAGSILPAWDESLAARATQLIRETCRHESFWVKRLNTLRGATMPHIEVLKKSNQRADYTSLDMTMPQSVLSLVSAHASWNMVAFLITAFAVYLTRVCGEQLFDLGLSSSTLTNDLAGLANLFSVLLPLRVQTDHSRTFDEEYAIVHEELELLRKHKTFLYDVLGRYPELRSIDVQGFPELLPVRVMLVDSLGDFVPEAGADLCLVVPSAGQHCRWVFNSMVLSESKVRLMMGQFITMLLALESNSKTPVGALPVLTDIESREILEIWNATDVVLSSEPMHYCFERQADKTPDAIALICRDQQLTYRQLNARANQFARHLSELGVGPEALVAIFVDRSIEMVVGLLGILKAGGAYVPLDPAYPADRIAFMLEDSKAAAIVTQQHLLSRLPSHNTKVVCVDSASSEIGQKSKENLDSRISPQNLAYVIYTSGSTGKPKGVMIEHRNVVNFFAGMDDRIGREPGAWLAVTSVSFDISILEIFWPLGRGFRVVLATDQDRLSTPIALKTDVHRSRSIDFSLCYFASELGGDPRERYRLLIEGAKFADENDFSAVWTPERHFHSFGGLFPNPSVAGAALATLTRRIGIRAGSVVAPLHHPVRIAEEWALVDNLSDGRVGISFASGWQANDFVFAPERYERRKQIMLDDIEMVRRLWRGESVMFRSGDGTDIAVKIYPSPIQAELPVWVTAAGNPETFEQAGKIGANILTHLLGQKIEDVEQKIRIYRAARAASGLPGRGQVTLMLHTYVGDSMEAVKAAVREPMCRYLGTSLDLIRNAPFAFPTFKLPSESVAEKVKQGLNKFSPADMEVLLGFAFDRYFETSGLFGTVEHCLETVDRCKAADVDEIGCLIDFGVPVEMTLQGLQRLNDVRTRSNPTASARPPAEDYSLLAQMKTHGVTHLQCTPSLARVLIGQAASLEAFSGLKRLILGGEALPLSLLSELRKVVRGEIHNMYGPTETTVWSTSDRSPSHEDFVTIGKPIANTQVYVVDRQLHPVPVGVPGELLIGGNGVARGYLNRKDLTKDRFIPNPFPGRESGLLYRTGDLVAWRSDGRIDFLGRLDDQVKIRGHRIELGEIEHAIAGHPAIATATMISRTRTPSENELVAFYSTHSGKGLDVAELRESLSTQLPEYMIPTAFVHRDDLPKTPNGKVDRKALAAMATTMMDTNRATSNAPPKTALERSIAGVFSEALGVEGIATDDNFFNLGANSLTLVRVVSKLAEMFPGRVELVDLFQHTTINSLALFLSNSTAPVETKAALAGNRGRQRREALLARRQN